MKQQTSKSDVAVAQLHLLVCTLAGALADVASRRALLARKLFVSYLFAFVIFKRRTGNITRLCMNIV